MEPTSKLTRPRVRQFRPFTTARMAARLSPPAARAIPQKTLRPRQRPQGTESLNPVAAPMVWDLAKRLATAPPAMRNRNTHPHVLICNRAACAVIAVLPGPDA